MHFSELVHFVGERVYPLPSVCGERAGINPAPTYRVVAFMFRINGFFTRSVVVLSGSSLGPRQQRDKRAADVVTVRPGAQEALGRQ